jgi:hypothetical protein
MLKITAVSSFVALSLAGAALGGPDYQALKACLDDCFRTTSPWTWARAGCVADCELDYVDSKLNFSVGIDPRSSGWTESPDGTGLAVLDWGTMPVVVVGFVVRETPQHRPIQRVEFRLMNPAHPPMGGGLLLAVVPGNNQPQGQFIANIQNNSGLIGEGGVLVAEIHYANLDDVDDVDVICVRSGQPPCPADFNGDGFIDFFDYDAFVNCFDVNFCPPGKTADMNGDGFTDFFDYDAYVEAFQTGC